MIFQKNGSEYSCFLSKDYVINKIQTETKLTIKKFDNVTI